MFITKIHVGVVVVVWTGFYGFCRYPGVHGYQDYDNPHDNVNHHPDYTMDHNDMYCFQCNSRQDPDCGNIQQNDTNNYFYKPCLDNELYDGHPPFCRKIVQRIYERDNMEIVIRKCGWIRHPRLDCYNVKNDDHEEVICQCFTPGCNGAAGLLPPLATVAVAQLASELWRKSRGL